jgi:charged multivesicular body protein 1
MGPAPSKNNSRRLEDIAFNMKVASKTWEKEANKMHAKCEQAEKKVIKEIQANNMDMANAITQEAISLKAQSNQYRRMAIKLNAVALRVDQAMRMKQFTKQLGQVTREMDDVLQCMDPKRVEETMDIFVKQFEDLDVSTSVVSEALDKQSEATTNQEEVNNYMAFITNKYKDDLSADLRLPLGVGNAAMVGAGVSSTMTGPERIATAAGGGPAFNNSVGPTTSSLQPTPTTAAATTTSSHGNDAADALAARLQALRKP